MSRSSLGNGTVPRQQFLDVTQAESEPEIEPYCLLNDLRRETIPAVADFRHPLHYWAGESAASLERRDNAVSIKRPPAPFDFCAILDRV